MAKLYFRYGAMGSGKTIDLLKVAYNYEERNQTVLLFSPAKDNRFGEGKITTRIGLQRNCICVKDDMNLFTYINDMEKKPDAILVDEAQFFTKAQIIQLSDVVDYFDIPVMCYGLRADFRIEFFPGSAALMAIADSIEEIKTVCECGKKATINMRFVNGLAVVEGDQVVIGGNDTYKSVCRKCYKKYVLKSKKIQERKVNINN